MTFGSRIFSAVLALCLLASAQDLNTLEPQGYVSDFAGVVDATSKQNIELYCARLQKATGAQIAIVTLQSVEGQPVEDVANDLFRRWGIGQKNEDNGLLFLLVVGERRSRLEVGRGLEPYITDGRAGATLRQMRPALRESRYGEALQIAATSLGQVIAESKGVQVDMGPAAPPIRRAPPPQTGVDGLPWPLILGGIFLLLMLFGRGGPRGGRGGGGGMGGLLPGIILGNMLGGRSYGGGYGGGGFGGYDSGDSFGGFGGGSSGGGGASSDW